jgi:hypothetical protein
MWVATTWLKSDVDGRMTNSLAAQSSERGSKKELHLE